MKKPRIDWLQKVWSIGRNPVGARVSVADQLKIQRLVSAAMRGRKG